MKSSEHLFFRLNDYKSFLTEWIPNHTSPDVAKKMMEWFKEDLRDWDISRDKPYFGFPIPGTNGEKYFYVWVDAPMGYVSSTAEWAEKTGSSFNDFWRHSVDTEVYHFIGKDIAYFHLLFWPAFLKGAGFRLPDKVFVHGHVMVNGEKMSKSKGTFISARTYLDHLNPEYLRYYYASKLSAPVHDLDLNLEDFVARVNSDLVGKITNLASRGAQMLKKRLDGKMGSPDGHGYQLIENAQNKSETIAEFFEAREFSKAINEIRLIADEANKYFDERAPWKTIDSDPEGTRQVLTTTLNLFRIIAIYLQPILPHYAERVAELLNETTYEWDHLFKILTQHEIRDYAHLATRIDPVQVQKMVEASKPKDETAKPAGEAASKSSSPKTQAAPAKPSSETANDGYIDIDDFMKVDLRVGKIIEAQEVPEADKLLKLKVELSPTDHRQIFAGIKSAYKAETLVGRQVLVVANLRPRKMKFGMSEGMVIAAGAGGKDIFVFLLRTLYDSTAL
jgi:methionyl-tRNA synthetase